MAKKQKITESPLKGEIILYHAPDGKAALDVRLEDNSLWPTQKQISEFLDTERSVITNHFGNIFRSGELDKNSVCAKFAHAAGKQQIVCHKSNLSLANEIAKIVYLLRINA